jgi:hypothetical protein
MQMKSMTQRNDSRSCLRRGEQPLCHKISVAKKCSYSYKTSSRWSNTSPQKSHRESAKTDHLISRIVHVFCKSPPAEHRLPYGRCSVRIPKRYDILVAWIIHIQTDGARIDVIMKQLVREIRGTMCYRAQLNVVSSRTTRRHSLSMQDIIAEKNSLRDEK